MDKEEIALMMYWIFGITGAICIGLGLQYLSSFLLVLGLIAIVFALQFKNMQLISSSKNYIISAIEYHSIKKKPKRRKS